MPIILLSLTGWVILNTYGATGSRSGCVIWDTNGGWWCVGFSEGIGYWDSHVVVFAFAKKAMNTSTPFAWMGS